ncbi:MAG TPA: hypothetical protein VFT45_19515 [Longimicrobium sp.]|nr:hypothetical protein [Longimicrobium sp.]
METMRMQAPGRVRSLGVLAYLWLMAGFAAGTAVLVGPVRWLTSGIQRLGWEQRSEDLVLRGFILAFVAGSFFLALYLARATLRARRRSVRMGIPGAATALAVLALWAWMNPGRMLAAVAGGDSGAQVTASTGAQFVFGAYPDANRLAELKKQGFTAVVSLQHPAVVPFEPASIEQERKTAGKLGIQFIHTPMLPWVSDNTAALDRIRQLVHSGRGKYYVHCGLGRDRTNVVRRMVEAEGAAEGVQVATAANLQHASTFADRLKLPPEKRDMERGAVRELAPGVWLVPHPNDSELAGYMLAGQVATVVLLLDPANPEQRAWRDEEETRLRQSAVAFVERPLHAGETAQAAALAREVRGLPKPVAVVAPRTPYSNDDKYPGTEAAVLFREAFTSSAPATLAAAPR